MRGDRQSVDRDQGRRERGCLSIFVVYGSCVAISTLRKTLEAWHLRLSISKTVSALIAVCCR